MTRESIQRALNIKLDTAFEQYRKDMLIRDPGVIFEHAAEIAITQQVYDELYGSTHATEYLAYLLRFANPLEVVRDQWQNEQNTDASQEFQHALWYLANKQDALHDKQYALDADYNFPELESSL